jgi:hypothetical protein
MLYAGTTAGPLCFAVYSGTIDSASPQPSRPGAMRRDFLDRLRQEAGGTVFLVMNEIAEQPPWLHVFRLPH